MREAIFLDGFAVDQLDTEITKRQIFFFDLEILTDGFFEILDPKLSADLVLKQLVSYDQLHHHFLLALLFFPLL